MTGERNMMKWYRPRWSVRTLAVVVALICVYLACWGPTKTRGVAQVQRECRAIEPVATAPFIIRADARIERMKGYYELRRDRHYYFWFFGYVAKLPFTTEAGPMRAGYDPLLNWMLTQRPEND